MERMAGVTRSDRAVASAPKARHASAPSPLGEATEPRQHDVARVVIPSRQPPWDDHSGNSMTRQKCCSMPIAFRKLWPGRCFNI